MKTLSTKKNPLVLCAVIAFTVGMANPAVAQKKEMNELLQEFFIGQPVFAQQKKEIQFTIKPAYLKQTGGSKLVSFPLQFEYGFTDRFQVELGLEHDLLYPGDHQDAERSRTVEVGFLYSILKGNKPFAMSIGLDMSKPIIKRDKDTGEIGETEFEWEPSLIIARQIGSVQVHANLGAEITKSESTLTYNLATAIPFGNWLGTLELNGNFMYKKSVYITPGIIYKGVDDFEFGLGVSRGSAEWGVILMATYEFSPGKRSGK